MNHRVQVVTRLRFAAHAQCGFTASTLPLPAPGASTAAATRTTCVTAGRSWISSWWRRASGELPHVDACAVGLEGALCVAICSLLLPLCAAALPHGVTTALPGAAADVAQQRFACCAQGAGGAAGGVWSCLPLGSEALLLAGAGQW